MKIKFEGEEYTFDLEELTVAQAKVIKVHTGMTLLGLEEGLSRGDPDALRALYWLMHAQSGKSCDIDRADFKIIAFSKALEESLAPEDEEGAEKPNSEESPKEEAPST